MKCWNGRTACKKYVCDHGGGNACLLDLYRIFNDYFAAFFGIVWLISRAWYALAYQQNPEKSGPALGLGVTCAAVLWVAAAYGIANNI